jgi:hypothetical protein
MAVATSFLYGDSTPSPLKIDFIAFLRDAIDFSVEALLCDSRLADAAQGVARLAESTEREIEGAEAFATEVSLALDRISIGDVGSSLAARCKTHVREAAAEFVRSEGDATRAAVVTEKARAAQAESGERASVTKAFEKLVLRHTLPEATFATHLRGRGATHYDAHLRGKTAYGLEWAVALEIPSSHLLAHILRIDRVIERLEIDAPEEAGWIHKETKLRPQRFDRLYLAALRLDETGATIELRAAPDGTGSGFDVSLGHDPPTARLVRIREGKAAADAPYDAAGENITKLRSLHDKLAAMTSELAAHKKKLLSASFDFTPVQEIERPRILAERLIANIAPTVQQISKRSLSPGELVLRRLLSDNRREELFLSRAEIDQKLEPLSTPLRRAFEPLKLWEMAPQRPEPAVSPPEPALPKSLPPPAHPSRGPSSLPLPKPAAKVDAETILHVPSPAGAEESPPPPALRPSMPPLPPLPGAPPPRSTRPPRLPT